MINTEIGLPYGRKRIQLRIPKRNLLGIITSQKQIPVPDPCGKIEKTLEQDLVNGNFSFREKAEESALPGKDKNEKTVCIVVSDITRPVPNKVILPPLLQCLEKEGIGKKNITILVATGLHRACKKEELLEMLGENIAKEYTILNHNARDKSLLDFLGYTPRGTPIWVNKYYLNADVKILTGLVEPHFMAGYSGGGKSICPGICGLETIRVHHSPKFLESSYAIPGVIMNNPFHSEISFITEKVRVDFIINVTLTNRKEISGIFVGEVHRAFSEAISYIDRKVKVKVGERADIVVASAGGYPLDTTFYQSVKGMVAALPLVKEGGSIIICASCSEGVGSREFEYLLRTTKSCTGFFNKIKAPDFFVIDQWEMEEMCRVLRKAKILYYTKALSDKFLEKTLVTPINSIQKTIDRALSENPKIKITVLPEGPYTIPEFHPS